MKIVHGYGNIGFNFSPKSEEFFGFPMLKDNISKMKLQILYGEKTWKIER